MNQLLLDRIESLSQDNSPHVIPEPVPGERPKAPVPVTKLTAQSEEEILQTIKDYAEYNLVGQCFLQILVFFNSAVNG